MPGIKGLDDATRSGKMSSPNKMLSCSDKDNLACFEISAEPGPEARAFKTQVQAPYWAKWLEWLLKGPCRTALTLGFFDVFAVSSGMMIGFAFSRMVLEREEETAGYLLFSFFFIMFLIAVFYIKENYGKLGERRPEYELQSIVTGSLIALLCIFIVDSINYKGIKFPQLSFIIAFVFSLMFIIVCRFGLRELLKTIWSYGLAREKVLVIGDNIKEIQSLLDQLHIQRYERFNVIGYLAQKPSNGSNDNLTYLGQFKDLPRIKKDKQIDKVLFAMRGYSDQRHQTLIHRLNECAKLQIQPLIISKIFNDFNVSLTLEGYSEVLTLEHREPAYLKRSLRFTKRLLDILGSLTILICSAPAWLIIILLIKLNDGGPIFFRHRLLGRNGKIFYAFKFRTMVMNAQEILKNDPELFKAFSANYKLENDPRITRVGKYLRKLSLDELPQVLNILKGDMSLVGPRPVKEEELERYGEFGAERIKIRPGLTGFWQVSGRCATSYEERMLMDKFYMYKYSIWLDAVIILKTPIAVFFGHGAT
ncbi:MAG: exopolysaccharide biosynthesis polyprenyl glycosylphosphotransferase [Deltaproteobacteria bacterium]|nr:MAG: exopolysaccharide biosynthesis polyprenyl glycosylphosphotransferase [Deltaproteobacteria bacterium]